MVTTIQSELYRIPEVARISRNKSAAGPGPVAADERAKLNVIPSVNCQSGAPVKLRRIPASNHKFFSDQGCQMTPRSAESR